MPAEVVDFNRLSVAETGEPHQLLHPEKLEGACARPAHHWRYGEQDMGVMAAALLLGIAQAHPFIQGNKRAAMVAANAFLLVNGLMLDMDDDALGLNIIFALEKGISETDFVEAFRRKVRPPRVPRRPARSVRGAIYRSAATGRYTKKR